MEKKMNRVKGKWETTFIRYEELMNRLNLAEHQKIPLLKQLFEILDHGSFQYQWIANAVEEKVNQRISSGKWEGGA